MIIVADSGSTKTDWRLYDKKHGVRKLQTIGLNPYFVNQEKVCQVLEKDLVPFTNPKDVSEIYFYGSGCTHSERIREIEYPLTDLYSEARVFVESDLLGTARALCGKSEGLIGILGTGSNTCVYDGCTISKQINSLGYVLGDEGSGATLGKTLLKAYFENHFPYEIQRAFAEKYPLSLENALDMIYRKPHPNRFLASFAPFATEHKSDPFITELLTAHFDEFFTRMVIVYEEYRIYKLSLSGSIAFYFREFIEASAQKTHVEIGQIIIQPVDELMNFHLQFPLE